MSDAEVVGGDRRLGSLSAARRELLARWAAAEAPARPDPETATEGLLRAVWEEVLGVTGIGPDDDYFALGGDSVLAVVVVARAGERGLAVSTHDLFEHPTLRALASAVDATAGPDRGGGAVVEGSSPATALTPLQLAMLFHADADPGSYTTHVTCRLVGDLDRVAWWAAWSEVVDRHAALRTRFTADVRGWQAEVVPSVALPAEEHDWSAHDEPEQRRRLAELAAAGRTRPLPLDVAPLMAIALVQLGPREHAVLWRHHHLVLDGWSQQVVLGDLLALYAAHAHGRPAGLPPVPPVTTLPGAGSDGDDAAEHWRELLAGAPLPAAVRRSSSTSEIAVPLAPTRPPCPGLTAATTALGAWALALARWRRSDDVVFGVVVSGRPEVAHADRLVGSFVTTLPVRAAVNPAAEVGPWLAELQRTGATSRRFQGASPSDIRRAAGIPQDRDLFDTVVVVESFPEADPGRLWDTGLELQDIATTIDERLPLVAEVTFGDRPRLVCRFDDERFAPPQVERLLAGFGVAVEAMASAASLGDAVERIDSVLRAIPGVAGLDRARDLRRPATVVRVGEGGRS